MRGRVVRVRSGPDGGWRVRLVDAGGALAAAEIRPSNPLPVPPRGARILIRGRISYNPVHGWYAVDPVEAWHDLAGLGVVRELQNVIERALVLGTGTVIGLEDLPDSLREKPPSNTGRVGGRRLADVEREHIVHTLRAVARNKAAAARVLGLDRKTLYRKLTQHQIAT